MNRIPVVRARISGKFVSTSLTVRSGRSEMMASVQTDKQTLEITIADQDLDVAIKCLENVAEYLREIQSGRKNNFVDELRRVKAEAEARSARVWPVAFALGTPAWVRGGLSTDVFHLDTMALMGRLVEVSSGVGWFAFGPDGRLLAAQASPDRLGALSLVLGTAMALVTIADV